jgi:hypothetical protein
MDSSSFLGTPVLLMATITFVFLLLLLFVFIIQDVLKLSYSEFGA